MTFYNGTHTAIAVYAVYECDSMGNPNKNKAPRLHAWETLDALQGSYKAALEQNTSFENKTDIILASITTQFGRCMFMQDGYQLCIQCIASEFMSYEENKLSIKDFETRIFDGKHLPVFDELIESLPDEPRNIFSVQGGRAGVGDWDGDCVGIVNIDNPSATKEPPDDEIVSSLVKQVKEKASNMSFTSEYGTKNAMVHDVLEPLVTLLDANRKEHDADSSSSTKDTSMSNIVSL